MDFNFCNFNLLAIIDDGFCLLQGDFNCLVVFDFVVDQGIFVFSIYLLIINFIDFCLIEEGCLYGYGQCDIVCFIIWIVNEGEFDYFIG